MTECRFKHFLNGETIHLVLLEFPLEDQKDENLVWLRTFRSKVEDFCDEYCFKIGALHILPKPYFPIVESFLRKMKKKYNEMGYNPTFKFLKVNLQGGDYLDLQALILERIRSRLETYVYRLEKEESNDDLLSDVLKEVAKVNELMIIFQLGKIFPEEATRIYDLISILNEKVAEFKIRRTKEVVVTEI